jgi:hypothetical protein
MEQTGFDLLARAIARRQSRRQALLAAATTVVGMGPRGAVARRNTKGSAQRGARGGIGFPRRCRHFVITAGPNRNDQFQHIDDDLLIEVIPRNGGATKVVFEDDNNTANGDNGEHLSVDPFTARVGDEIHIVARNEAPGGCELDEIWLHCIEGRGGKIQLTDAILPEDCRPDADRVGVFFETTIRISSK